MSSKETEDYKEESEPLRILKEHAIDTLNQRAQVLYNICNNTNLWRLNRYSNTISIEQIDIVLNNLEENIKEAKKEEDVPDSKFVVSIINVCKYFEKAFPILDKTDGHKAYMEFFLFITTLESIFLNGYEKLNSDGEIDLEDELEDFLLDNSYSLLVSYVTTQQIEKEFNDNPQKIAEAIVSDFVSRFLVILMDLETDYYEEDAGMFMGWSGNFIPDLIGKVTYQEIKNSFWKADIIKFDIKED